MLLDDDLHDALLARPPSALRYIAFEGGTYGTTIVISDVMPDGSRFTTRCPARGEGLAKSLREALTAHEGPSSIGA